MNKPVILRDDQWLLIIKALDYYGESDPEAETASIETAERIVGQTGLDTEATDE
jgi:hypothetical protein